jgi:hypothetical protein
MRCSRRWLRRTPSSVMRSRVALLKTDVSQECTSSIIRMTRIGEQWTMLDVTGNRNTLRRNSISANVLSSPILVTLMTEAIHSSYTSCLTWDTRHHNPEGGILLRHRRDDLSLTNWSCPYIECGLFVLHYEYQTFRLLWSFPQSSALLLVCSTSAWYVLLPAEILRRKNSSHYKSITKN